MKSALARLHTGLAWLLFLGSIIQFFLISLTVFGAAGSEVHGTAGGILMLLALIMAIVALIIRVNKWNVILSILVLLLLFPIQGIFVHLEGIPGAFRALHGLNGLLILGLTYVLAKGFARATVPDDISGMMEVTAATD